MSDPADILAGNDKPAEEQVAPRAPQPRTSATDIAKAAADTAAKALEGADAARAAAVQAKEGVDAVRNDFNQFASLLAGKFEKIEALLASQPGAPAPPPVRNVIDEDLMVLVERLTPDDTEALAKALRNKAIVQEYKTRGFNPFTQVIAKGRTKTRYKGGIIETVVGEPYDIDGFTPRDFEHLKVNGVFDPPKLG
jgi:hypothetical protein